MLGMPSLLRRLLSWCSHCGGRGPCRRKLQLLTNADLKLLIICIFLPHKHLHKALELFDSMLVFSRFGVDAEVKPGCMSNGPMPLLQDNAWHDAFQLSGTLRTCSTGPGSGALSP